MALAIGAALAGCGARVHAPLDARQAEGTAGETSALDVSPADAPRTAARQVSLEGGLIAVELLAPLEPSGPKAAVVGPPALGRRVIHAGGVAVSYAIDWSRLGAAPSLDVPENPTAGQPPLAAESAAVLGEPFFHRIAIAANAILPRVLDWLETLPEVDPERIALVGIGEEGFVVLTAAAHDERVAAVAALFACGDFAALLRDSPSGGRGAPLALDPGYAAWLRAESPLADPRRLIPAPVLLASRRDDPLVPASCVESSARALAGTYAPGGAADRVQYLALPAGDDGQAAALAWVDHWLFGR